MWRWAKPVAAIVFRVDTPVGRSAEDLVRHILEFCDGV